MITVGFDVFKGKTFVEIKISKRKDAVAFLSDCGEKYLMYHINDCCEIVELYDVCGDLSDLIGKPILIADEVVSRDKMIDGVDSSWKQSDDSFTWTFYKLATFNGYVDFRWLGESNGYYSEEVEIYKFGNDCENTDHENWYGCYESTYEFVEKKFNEIMNKKLCN